MTWDKYRYRIQPNGVRNRTNACPVIAKLRKVAVAAKFHGSFVFYLCFWLTGVFCLCLIRICLRFRALRRMGQFPKLSPNPFLKIGAEKQQIFPLNLFPKLPDLIDSRGNCRHLIIYNRTASRLFGGVRTFCQVLGDLCEYSVICGYSCNLAINADDYPFSGAFHSQR